MKDNRPPDPEVLRQMIDAPPIARVVNLIVSQAVSDNATGAHIDPLEDKLRVRYRVDNRLQDVMEPPKEIQHAVVGRIKVMADMDIAEWRIPQVGSIELNHEGRDFKVQVSTFPCVHGEKVVLQFLPCEAALALDRMQLSDFNQARIQGLLESRSGMLLVVGKTRSGKSTVLRSLVRELNDEHRNIFTVERSVGHQIEGVNQIEVNPRAGLVESSVIRSVMRGDPDVIMVERLHGSEAGRLAFEAAASKYLVLAGCYQDDAAAGVCHLNHLNVEAHLVAHGLRGVWAQTLLPRLCEECKQPQTPPANIEGLEEGVLIYRRMGCQACNQSGYSGLIGVQEVLITSEELQEAILRRAPVSEFRKLVDVPMRTDALEKLKEGRISLLDFVCEFEGNERR